MLPRPGCPAAKRPGRPATPRRVSIAQFTTLERCRSRNRHAGGTSEAWSIAQSTCWRYDGAWSIAQSTCWRYDGAWSIAQSTCWRYDGAWSVAESTCWAVRRAEGMVARWLGWAEHEGGHAVRYFERLGAQRHADAELGGVAGDRGHQPRALRQVDDRRGGREPVLEWGEGVPVS